MKVVMKLKIFLSLVLGVGHYRWLRDPIRRLPPNSKADYLIRTIRRILDFLQL
jgi:hypothetical protein